MDKKHIKKEQQAISQLKQDLKDKSVFDNEKLIASKLLEEDQKIIAKKKKKKYKPYKQREIIHHVVKTGPKTIENLIKYYSPCKVTYTVNSVSIYSKKYGRAIYSRDGMRLTFPEMRFINSFRQYFKKRGKNLKYIKDFRYKHAKFIQFKRKPVGIYKDVIQIDINQAYPTAARLLNIVPEELFLKGTSISKRASLIAIGSLHRQRRKISVDKDGKRKLIEVEERIGYMSNIWRSIVNFTDQAMQKLFTICGDDAYFYWVDAIFCKKEKVKAIQDELRKWGFSSKIIEIKTVEYTEQKVIAIHADGERKEYQLSKQLPYHVNSKEEVIAQYKPQL